MKPYILITLPALLTISLAHANPNWIADPDTLCKVYNPNPLPNESITWQGDCKEGYAHGTGTLHFLKDGKINETFVGTYQNGRANGQGIAKFSNGDRYEGGWQDDKMHGTGVYTTARGSVYTGEWVNGSMHGKGVYRHANGSRYEGEWANDYYEGVGSYTDADGLTYTGEWVNGERHGWGVQQLADGLTFEGQFLHNRRHGLGRYIASKAYAKKAQQKVGYWQGDVYIWAGRFYEDNSLKQETLTKAQYEYALTQLGKDHKNKVKKK